MNIKRYLIAGLSLGMLAATFASSSANAAPSNTGYDDNPDVVIGGGSDTTYLVQQRLDTLYNGAPGCALDVASASTNKGKCLGAPASTGDTKGNYDHDDFVEAAAIGSGAGINALLPPAAGGVQYNPAINYARSSRIPSSTELASTTGWGYARDAIAVVTFGTRNANLSKDDLFKIYSCTYTTWGQIPDGAGGFQFPGDATPIVPWDMNSASGTRSTFVTWMGNPSFGSCVRKLSNGVAPFENDVKPILADSSATVSNDSNNYVWWMSYGDWKTYPYTNSGTSVSTGSLVTSNLVALTNDYTVAPAIPTAANTNNQKYPVLRTLYLVTKNTDADCVTTPGAAGLCNNAADTVYGASGGTGGAVRQFVAWLCHPSSASHTIDSVTGVDYKTESNSAINAEGFQTVPAALRTSGYGCSVAT